jgi:hypothetical protein
MNNFFLCLVLVLLFCPKNNFGQEIHHDTTSLRQFNNSVFVELLGANGYLSINYERSLFKKERMQFKIGVGGGYFNSSYSPKIFSLTLRSDLSYQLMKNIRPTMGFAISHVVEVVNVDGSENVDYLVPAPNVGLDFVLFKRIHLLPKYYLLISKRINDDVATTVDIMHWGGLQLKYDF